MNTKNFLRILGIETTCDETSFALMTRNIISQEKEIEILRHSIQTQHVQHAPFLGIVPEIAARSHVEFSRSILKNWPQGFLTKLDIISFASSPGLLGGIIVGSLFGSGMSLGSGAKIFPVNHLVAHLLIARLTEKINFPYLGLLISGGHTQIVWMKSAFNYNVLGSTRDDALGEAFDKVGRILGLGFPGGPAVEKSAKKGDKNKFLLPKPFYKAPHCDFSFSGLKTAVKKIIATEEIFDQKKYDLCASFQKSISSILCDRLGIAIEKIRGSGFEQRIRIAAVGGVASNTFIRKDLKNFARTKNCDFFVPPKRFCSDNAAMIAYAASEIYLEKKRRSKTSLTSAS